MKVAICTPVHRVVDHQFAQSLANMVAATMAPAITYNGAITRPQIRVRTCDDGGLEYKRTRLALDALEWGTDYILWCDSDHVVPDDGLLRLLKHDQPIIGATYATRRSGRLTGFDLTGKPLEAGTGVEQVAALGFGFLLMKAPVFERVPRPWFVSEMLPEGRAATGEDVHFCNQARKAGLPIFVDHDLRVGHIASRVIFGENANAGSVLSASGP